MRSYFLLLVPFVFAAACSSDSDNTPNPDTSPPTPDARIIDGPTGGPDGAVADTAVGDDTSPTSDSATGDTASSDDGGASDATTGDSAAADSSPPDSTVDVGITGTACTENSECAPDHWCRDTQDGAKECVPYALEGATCGGYTVPWAQQLCHPDQLICTDLPAWIADAPGRCRRSCAGTPCPTGQYCSRFNTVCRDMGSCFDDLDCDASANNDYTHDACSGYGVCTSGSCGWICGDPACRDLKGRFFGPCAAVLGWAVVDGICTQVSGCDAEGYSFFASQSACQSACP